MTREEIAALAEDTCCSSVNCADCDALRKVCAEALRLHDALAAIADLKKLPSHGDPVVLRDFARAALEAQNG